MKRLELLKQKDIPIINISFELGFAEPIYFTKYLKKVEGITPSQYRNKHHAWN
ncbi:AraC family transcriptional regulator [Anaerobacillus sp. HL2]|nr:AraC family transcriptional regulator [Anaerobacillus sp. HL2]